MQACIQIFIRNNTTFWVQKKHRTIPLCTLIAGDTCNWALILTFTVESSNFKFFWFFFQEEFPCSGGDFYTFNGIHVHIWTKGQTSGYKQSKNNKIRLNPVLLLFNENYKYLLLLLWLRCSNDWAWSIEEWGQPPLNTSILQSKKSNIIWVSTQRVPPS